MSLGRWADAQISRGEVRARGKIGRIAGQIPSVFRHGSDENGVGWSDLVSSSEGANSDEPNDTLTLAARTEESHNAVQTGCKSQYERVERCEQTSIPASGESALVDALAMRLLLACDAESTIAGQALRLRGSSLPDVDEGKGKGAMPLWRRRE
jgi:hypothetical protein